MRDRVVRQYTSGMSAVEVASDIGIAKSTVLRILNDTGADVRPRGRRIR